MVASLKFSRYLTVAMIFTFVYLFRMLINKYFDGDDLKITLLSLKDDPSDAKNVIIFDWTGFFGQQLDSEIG